MSLRERTDILPSREARRGELLNVTLIVCQRCLDETAERVHTTSEGYTVGTTGDEARDLGWRVIDFRWFCPPCADQVRAYLLDPLP